MELPTLSSWSYPNLKLSPARYEGSVYLNNLILLAHNYSAHFGQVHRLEEGDLVRFKDMENNIFDYSVKKIEELDSNQLEEMVSGDWDLTLFTCTLGGATRVTVRCEAVNREMP